VRRYLGEFLADPRVLDINPVGRWALLNLVILPFRPRKSAAAYQKIWTERGSPLLTNGLDLVAAVRDRLGAGWAVELGMRYQKPSIASALERLRLAGADRVVVLPLYPQYAAASTGSSVEEIFRVASQPWVTPTLCFVEPFYDDPGFLDAFAERGRDILAAEKPDHVLFSFHGLPERHMRKADATGAHCLASVGCCDRIVDANRNCYRAQCFATARGLVDRLALPAGATTVTFQSRLGRTPWIRPYTDVVLLELAAPGEEAPRRVLSRLRRRLPRDARGDRPSRAARLRGRRRRAVDARAFAERERPVSRRGKLGPDDIEDTDNCENKR
jgi:protoporphyrin/coproporphyrin ferrochelatase